ncbi:MAG: hypothetical protein LCH95_15505 [Proteobacteria bacterium]|nr:hypothetical protein [Pseudomonadota bacterium]
MRAVWIVVLAGLLAVPAAAQEAMSRKQLAAAGAQQIVADAAKLVDTTSYVIVLVEGNGLAKGDVFPMYYRDARTRILKARNGRRSESNWWIEGPRLCAEQRIVQAGHLCYDLYQHAGNTYACIAGTESCPYSFRSVPGNPEGIK